jgi:hypothetical protein
MPQADDPWHYSRESLAQRYFDQFDSGLSHANVIFGLRRTGKTEFLLKDLGPLAQANGWRVAYVSLWQSRLSPLAVLLHAFSSASRRGSLVERAEALARATRPKLKLGAGAPGGDAKAEIEVDLSELRGPPTHDALLHLDDLIDRFARPNGRALLLIDEAQELAANEDNQPLVAALRTSLDQRKGRLAVLFTGSSQDGLRRMFSRRDAPFFHFGSPLDWPPLEDGFVDHMLATFAKIVRVKLNRRDCLKAHYALDRNPYFFRKMLELLAFDPHRDVAAALAMVRERAAEDLRYPDVWRSLSPLQRAVAQQLSQATEQPFGRETLASIGRSLGARTPTRAQTLAAIRHLTRAGIVSRTGERGGYVFNDPEFGRWITARAP